MTSNFSKIVQMRDLQLKIDMRNNMVSVKWIGKRGNISQLVAMTSDLLVNHANDQRVYRRVSPFRFTNKTVSDICTIYIQYGIYDKEIETYTIRERKLFDVIEKLSEVGDLKDVFYIDLLDYMHLFTAHVRKNNYTGQYSTRRWNDVVIKDLLTKDDLIKQGFIFPDKFNLAL